MVGALNSTACFTPIKSPVSNGIAEAFVKNFKHNYVLINPPPDARTVLAAIKGWFEDYSKVHSHSGFTYQARR